jgi:hypothetical protein
MPVKGKITGANLYKEVRKVLQCLGIPVQERSLLVTNGAPSLAERRIFADNQRREESNRS